MKKVLTAVLFVVSAFLALGGAMGSALAHHDDAKGSSIVFEGGGGR